MDWTGVVVQSWDWGEIYLLQSVESEWKRDVDVVKPARRKVDLVIASLLSSAGDSTNLASTVAACKNSNITDEPVVCEVSYLDTAYIILPLLRCFATSGRLGVNETFNKMGRFPHHRRSSSVLQI